MLTATVGNMRKPDLQALRGSSVLIRDHQQNPIALVVELADGSAIVRTVLDSDFAERVRQIADLRAPDVTELDP